MGKSIRVATLAMCTLSCDTALAGQYEAVLSCGMSGQHINVLACFTDTELKLSKDGQTVIYKIYNLGSAGTEYTDGLHLELPSNFSIMAQNSHKMLVLELKIMDSGGTVVFQDQAGQYDVISVRN